MLKNLGRYVWSQTRDMQVYNYPKAILYEVRTSDGGVWLKYCKNTDTYTVGKQKHGDVAELFTGAIKRPLPSGKPCDIEFSPH